MRLALFFGLRSIAPYHLAIYPAVTDNPTRDARARTHRRATSRATYILVICPRCWRRAGPCAPDMRQTCQDRRKWLNSDISTYAILIIGW